MLNLEDCLNIPQTSSDYLKHVFEQLCSYVMDMSSDACCMCLYLSFSSCIRGPPCLFVLRRPSLATALLSMRSVEASLSRCTGMSSAQKSHMQHNMTYKTGQKMSKYIILSLSIFKYCKYKTHFIL